MQNDIKIDGFNISTWYSEHVEPDPYIAVNMTRVIEGLYGYDSTEHEKISFPEMMAEYCQLVEESGLIGRGKTELSAVLDLFSK